MIRDLAFEAQAVIYAVGFASIAAITAVCGLFAWLDSRASRSEVGDVR